MDNINMNNINKKVYEVGILKQDVIDLLNLNISEKTICFSDDKILYTSKHKFKFDNEEQYKKCIESTPDIIDDPDYIALHPNGQSIEFIKEMDKIMLVAVRVKREGSLWVKSVYPITQAKLELYLNSGTAKKRSSLDKSK